MSLTNVVGYFSQTVSILIVFLVLSNISVIQTKVIDKRQTHDNADTKLNSCDIEFFQSRNITISSSFNDEGSICEGHCCNSAIEAQLKEHSRYDFSAVLQHNSKSLLGPMSRTSALLQNHISDLTYQSENKTKATFFQIYQGLARLSVAPTERLYQAIRDYITIDNGNILPENITTSVERFFIDLFPLEYYHQSQLGNDDSYFTPDYVQCLKENIDIINPFGDYPKSLAHALTKSLNATRLLLQAFDIGLEVLNKTITLITQEQSAESSECHVALMRMTYCPKCLALSKNTKPCGDYCLNVLRGCLTKYVFELDSPWNNYVEGVEHLINAMRKSANDEVDGFNADVIIRNMDAVISNAVMYSMHKNKDISNKAKMSCKLPEFTSIPQNLKLTSASNEEHSAARIRNSSINLKTFKPYPETHMATFLSIILKTKSFYAKLADNLCSDESFVEQRGRTCWNGERIAEYTKPVVNFGPMQKYNPEMKTSQDSQLVDPKIVSLADRLRQVHTMALTSLGPSYVDDYMLRDANNNDGSGSGNGPDFDDDDDDHSRGSGSGNGPIDPDIDEDRSNTRDDTPNVQTIPVDRTSSSSRLTVTINLRISFVFSFYLILRKFYL